MLCYSGAPSHYVLSGCIKVKTCHVSWIESCEQFLLLLFESSYRPCVQGLPRKGIPAQARELLEKVMLTSAQHIRSGSYSGGMKRRLSVATALLGNPRIVYLVMFLGSCVRLDRQLDITSF
jgi:ABC-type dipeptide/oligopeptide/nickel transport system ATPase component